MRVQSSSESGRVAYCLPIGITSLKTKCVRLTLHGMGQLAAAVSVGDEM